MDWRKKEREGSDERKQTESGHTVKVFYIDVTAVSVYVMLFLTRIKDYKITASVLLTKTSERKQLQFL